MDTVNYANCVNSAFSGINADDVRVAVAPPQQRGGDPNKELMEFMCKVRSSAWVIEDHKAHRCHCFSSWRHVLLGTLSALVSCPFAWTSFTWYLQPAATLDMMPVLATVRWLLKMSTACPCHCYGIDSWRLDGASPIDLRMFDSRHGA